MTMRWSGFVPGWLLLGVGLVLCSAGVGLPVLECFRGGVTDGPLRPAMVVVPAGTFTQGSGESEGEAQANERPAHLVTLRSFAIAVTEVTQGQYLRVMGERPSSQDGDDNLPVETVTWFDAVRFANRLSQLESLTPCYRVEGEQVTWVSEACGYRLPTEAEWEYAARSSQATKYAGSDSPEEVAWYGSNASAPQPVGTKKPNAWGLYDMSGNVWEWAWDLYEYKYSAQSAQDPRGPKEGYLRVYRGGSIGYDARVSRVASRDGVLPVAPSWMLGFRLVRSLP